MEGKEVGEEVEAWVRKGCGEEVEGKDIEEEAEEAGEEKEV